MDRGMGIEIIVAVGVVAEPNQKAEVETEDKNNLLFFV